MKRILLLLTGLLFSISSLQAQNPGDLDLTFNSDGVNYSGGANSTVSSIVQQSDGKILIGGDFTSYNGTEVNRIARLNGDGSLDGSFNPGTGATGSVQGIAIQPDGKILIGGNFTSYNGTSVNRIVRLNADGSIDAGFNLGTGPNSSVFSIILQPDGKILIGGNFTSYNGTPISRIARLNADGSLDTSFNPGTGFNNSTLSIALQPDGKILVGGNFTSYNQIPRNYLTRLNADGTLDTSFDPGTVAILTVNAVALQQDGKVLIGGSFISVNQSTFHRIGRLNSDGTMDTSFIPGTAVNNTVLSITPQPDGKILIGGVFNAYGSTSRNRIARLNADGTLDSSFNPGSGANSSVQPIYVQSVAIQPGGKILIGGSFSMYNGVSSEGIARVYGDLEETDNEAPVPDVEFLQTINAQCQVNFEELTIPTATDGVDGSIQGTTDQSIFPIITQGPNTITWTYTDGAGNTSSQQQTVIIDDTIAPEITAPENLIVDLNFGEIVATGVQLGIPITSDNCNEVNTSNNTPLEFPIGSTEVIWAAIDAGGNESTAIQTVLVNAPACATQINVQPSVAVDLDQKNLATLKISDLDLGSSSSCGKVTLSLSQTEFTCTDLGENEVLFTVTDENGNVSSATVIVTVRDSIAPIFDKLPKSITISLNEGDPYLIPDFSSFVTDNCSIDSYTQSIDAGTVIITSDTLDVEISATDASGNSISATVQIERTAPKVKGGKTKRLIPGDQLLISVPWNTSFDEVEADIETEEGILIGWKDEGYDPLTPGLYQITPVMTPQIEFRYKDVMVTVAVEDKPKALDIKLSGTTVLDQPKAGDQIAILSTIDPVDDIHTYRIEGDPNLAIEGNKLVWKGSEMPAAQMKVTVFSTDRAGQTISKEVTLTRETLPNEFLLYPNPAGSETNVMVQLNEGATVGVQLFDAAGRLIVNETAFHEETFVKTFNLDGLAPGLYTVQVKIGWLVMTKRLIKQ